jgi:excisionase family DNA binding protein
MALLTVSEAAKRLECSKALVYLLCMERKLSHVRLGSRRGTIRIDERDLETFLQDSKVRAHGTPETLKHIRASR